MPGDMRNLSAPISPLSSGTLPGQISMTNGPAAAADPATSNDKSTVAADAVRCMRLILLRSAFALRVDRHLGDFSALLTFDLVVRLAVLQSFHRFQTGGAAKIFLRRCADGLRQLIELNGDLRAQ